jgi:hypothetical protein
MEMAKDKAPGPNGFTTDFFPTCWPIIKQDIWGLVEDSQNFANVLPTLDTTFLTLIPKEESTDNPPTNSAS